MNGADSSRFDQLRGRALLALVRPLLHDVNNRTLPFRSSVELVARGGAPVPSEVLFESLEGMDRLLKSLSRFASGSFEEGPVDLQDWLAEFEVFARPLCRKHGVELDVEPTAQGVADADLWPVLVAFLAVVAEHVRDGAAPIRVWLEREERGVAVGLSIDRAEPEVGALVDGFHRVHVGTVGDGLVLRAEFDDALLRAEAPIRERRARVLVLEPVDPFGALTEDVLRDAGHQAVGATPGRADLASLLGERWDLVLFDRRLEAEHAELLSTLEAAAQRVRFLGEGGLPQPFDPQSLLHFVDRELVAVD